MNIDERIERLERDNAELHEVLSAVGHSQAHPSERTTKVIAPTCPHGVYLDQDWCPECVDASTADEPAAVEMLPLRCGNPECGCAAMEEPKTKSTPFFKGTVTFGDTAYAHDGEGGVAVKTSEPSPSLRCKTCGGMAVTGEYCSDPCKMASNRCKNCGIAVGESADYCSDHCERRTAMS